MIGLALFAFIFASIGFGSGVIASAYVPSLPAAGRGAVKMIAGKVRPMRPNARNKPIGPTATAGSGATMVSNLTVKSDSGQNIAHYVANLARAGGVVLAFVVKRPVLALGLALVAFWLLSGARLPFAWGKSKGELRLEAELARVNTELARHETHLANLATSLSERTNRVRERARNALQESRQDVAHAVDAEDFDLLYSAYERGYRRVLNYGEPASGANPGAERAAPMPGPAGNPV